MFDVLDSLLDQLSASPWTYAIVFAVAAFDVLVPILPSESAVILAGVLAGSGDLQVLIVIPAGAAGAMLGDNLAYWIGRSAGTRLVERFAGGERAQRRLAWAERQLDERGGGLIVSARFIPGGRTAATLAAGTLEMPWRRFLAFDLLAALVWASFAALLGYFGGKAFEDDPTIALLIAFAVTVSLTVLVEVVRTRRARRRRRAAA